MKPSLRFPRNNIINHCKTKNMPAIILYKKSIIPTGIAYNILTNNSIRLAFSSYSKSSLSSILPALTSSARSFKLLSRTDFFNFFDHYRTSNV